jgi:hypothetical protein
MRAGYPFGRRVLSGRDLLGDPPVDAHGRRGLGRRGIGAAPGHGLRPRLFLRRPQGDKAADHVADGGVRGERDEYVVELPGDPGERHPVLGQPGGLLDIGVQLGDDRLGAVRSPGAFGGTQRFEQSQAGGQVPERDPARLQREPEVVGRRRLVGAVHLGASDLAATHRHQALGLEDTDGLPDRRIADAELADELVLGGETVAVGAVTGQDPSAQLSRHGLRDAMLRHATAAGIGHWTRSPLL